MSKFFSTEVRAVFEREYVKVFLLDDSRVQEIKEALSVINEIRNINITESESKDHPGKTLTVYPESMVPAAICQQLINESLERFFKGEPVVDEKAKHDAIFDGIEGRILGAFDKAQAMIDVCMAWFTNEILRDKLLEMKDRGIDIRVIIFKDGVNSRCGVDLTGLNHKEIRADNGGIMHNKFCVIDNNVVITGSYNWTTNAETRNDENITIIAGDVAQASKYTREFNSLWK